jgi:hypothetical protein
LERNYIWGYADKKCLVPLVWNGYTEKKLSVGSGKLVVVVASTDLVSGAVGSRDVTASFPRMSTF